MTRLIDPHGGTLKNGYLAADEALAAKEAALDYPSWDLSQRQLCDLELLLNGGFSPLEGFMNSADYDRVVADMRLVDGTLWPMPITLDVRDAFAGQIEIGDTIALRDQESVLIATMTVESKWTPDKEREASEVYRTTDIAHPGVDHLLHRAHAVYLGGSVSGIERPTHYDFMYLRDSPQELRRKFDARGWSRIVAFQTRNPMHRAHQEMTYRAAQSAEANLLIHPVVGMTMPGDINHFSRARCYELIVKSYPEQTTALSLLPLAMRMAGPREAVWHAIIRKNFGCSHFIVGRHHAAPGKNSEGEDFYGPYDAQDMLRGLEPELGIRMIPFKEMVYVQDRGQYLPADEVQPGETVLTISGTEFRRRLRAGLEIPDWFSFPEVVAELRKTHPPRDRQGFTVFFTGLPSAGKSTIANALMLKLLELGGRATTLLDGDVVRKHLSSELGFSKEHRNLNILRIGFVASQITKSGGIAICAPIAPYANIRRQVRELIEPNGGFIEVYVSTPIETCERRDRKGLYAKARAGVISGVTGIDDPYEVPADPELEINTEDYTPDQAAQRVVLKLEGLGFIK
ncbi:MAG: bifunctional sulfate adenylyltransferase/adenylylsulfate kinase [Alphaproteobacteria bacterium]|nr:bifunctional sulfate adenylyltransferase/adenylylsulfate kinase [Alphaproteobacteria bacterium]